MKLKEADIRRFIGKKEDERVEFKRAASELPDNLWETYSAFCNTDGGTIILGIREGKNKTYSIEGVSDAHNTAIFNIFALVDIGERSGMGLANLHGLWKKYGYAEPKITESYDPDRTVIVVTTDDDTVNDTENDTVTRPENGAEPDQNPTRSAPKVPQECPNGAPKVPQKCPNGAPRGDNNFENDTVNDTVNKSSVENDTVNDTVNKFDTQDGTVKGLKSTSELPTIAKEVYFALAEDPFMTYNALMSKLDIGRASVARAIGTLIKKHFICRVGSDKGGHWEIMP